MDIDRVVDLDDMIKDQKSMEMDDCASSDITVDMGRDQEQTDF